MDPRSTDFRAFLDEIGVTREQMDAARLESPDPLVVTSDPIHRVLPSGIEGRGVFSCGHFNAGDRVCTLRVDERWTVSGRYTNHAPAPNLTASVAGNELVGWAARSIREGDEITLDYRQVRLAGPATCDRRYRSASQRAR